MTEEKDNQSVSVSIIKYVADRVETENRLTTVELAGLKELIFARFSAEKQAAQLAYTELQRRLDVLNHNHEEMNKRNAYFLPREVYDQFKDQTFGPWRDTVNAFQNNLIGKISFGVGAVGVVVVLISHFWK
jgi:hypothetical protein